MTYKWLLLAVLLNLLVYIHWVKSPWEQLNQNLEAIPPIKTAATGHRINPEKEAAFRPLQDRFQWRYTETDGPARFETHTDEPLSAIAALADWAITQKVAVESIQIRRQHDQVLTEITLL